MGDKFSTKIGDNKMKSIYTQLGGGKLLIYQFKK